MVLQIKEKGSTVQLIVAGATPQLVDIFVLTCIVTFRSRKLHRPYISTMASIHSGLWLHSKVFLPKNRRLLKETGRIDKAKLALVVQSFLLNSACFIIIIIIKSTPNPIPYFLFSSL